MKHSLFIIIVALLLTLGGCNPAAGVGSYVADAPARVSAVDDVMPSILLQPFEIHTGPRSTAEVSPGAVPEGQSTGVKPPNRGGFEVAVWFFVNDQPAPVLVSGRVEILMFDGVVSPDALPAATPLHVWNFPGDRLGPFAGRVPLVGWGYNFGLLEWGDDAPTQNRVTVLVRYTAGPRPVYSAPQTVIVRETTRQ
jgi:predicted small secreted protein